MASPGHMTAAKNPTGASEIAEAFSAFGCRADLRYCVFDCLKGQSRPRNGLPVLPNTLNTARSPLPPVSGLFCVLGAPCYGPGMKAANDNTDPDREPWSSRAGAWVLVAFCVMLALSFVL